MGDMENETLSDASDCLASALLKSHEPKYLEAEESLQNLTYVTTMLRFYCVSYIYIIISTPFEKGKARDCDWAAT